jgi:hypothetical protein
MSDMNPYPLTQAEWKEIRDIPVVRDAWGTEDNEDLAVLSSQIYAVKFNFVSGGPGYVGDLFILQGDALTGDQPFVLRRGQDGKLVIL